MCYCGCSAENSNGECKLTKNYLCDEDDDDYDEDEEYDEYGGEEEISEEEQAELDSAAEDRYFGK